MQEALKLVGEGTANNKIRKPDLVNSISLNKIRSGNQDDEDREKTIKAGAKSEDHPV